MSPPILVLRRTLVLRLVLALFVLPLALLTAWGAVAAARGPHPEPVIAGVLGVLGLAILIVFVHFFRREMQRQTRLHEEGIARVVGSQTTEMRWDDVKEIWFEAVRVQAGGLLGVAVGAAVKAASGNRGGRLNSNTTNITVRLVGNDGTRLSLSSNDQGVVPAFEEILSRVNPRLLASAAQTVRQARAASFGPVSVTERGVALGRQDPVPYGDIESLSVKGGKLRLKKRGSWLDAFAIPIKKVPNVFVLTDLYQELSQGQGAAETLGANLARTTFI